MLKKTLIILGDGNAIVLERCEDRIICLRKRNDKDNV